MPHEEEEEAEDEDGEFMQQDYPDRNFEDPHAQLEAQDLGNEVVSGSEQEHDLTPEEV